MNNEVSRYIRVIPRLDIKGPNLVKGIKLEGLRALGEPEQFAKYYYDAGFDELCYVDVVASLYERNSLTEFISKAARDVFIPITVGGGLRTIDDIKSVLDAGADKVSLNTAAIKNPKIIEDAATKFGASTIVITIETIRQGDGRYLCFVDNGREFTGVDAIEWARRVVNLGAGEIILTSVDREGTGEGFDIELIKQVTEAVSVPVVAHGGAGSVKDVVDLVQQTRVNGIALASVLHYGALDFITAPGESSVSEGNFSFVRQNKKTKLIDPVEPRDLFDALRANNVICRANI